MSECKGCSGDLVGQEIIEIAKKYERVNGGIIGALHEVQSLHGYISIPAQKYLSKTLNVPMSEIYGIITFYSRFSLTPKGKYNIQVCMGTACYVKGSEKILDRFKSKLGVEEGQTTKDGKYSLEAVRCIGACGLAPAIVVNNEVYGKMDVTKVDALLEKYNNM